MTRFQLSLVFLFSTYFSSIGALNAQVKSHQVYLNSGTIDLKTFESLDEFEEDIANWPSYDGQHFGLINLKTYPSKDEWMELEAVGIRKVSYLPKHTFLISLELDAGIEALISFVPQGYLEFSADFKMNSSQALPERAMLENGHVVVNIHPFSTLDFQTCVSTIGALDFEVLELEEKLGYMVVSCAESQIDELKQLAFVRLIDWKYDAGHAENYTGRTMHRVNYLSPENSNGIGFDGEGINVMLQDDGDIGPHIDHHGRIIEQYWGSSNGDHGDHCGGIINGAGNLNPYYEGQAKGSNLYVYKAAPEYQGFDSIETHYTTKDIVITSTSYSNGCNAGYTALARTMDEQVYDLENLIHVFSAGNSGTSNCGYGAGNTWGNVTGGHKIGKNVITVANLDGNDQVATSSSRGPAHDGRIKPDISAKGSSVVSTIEDNTYGTKSGTSMSCPGVAGTLTVLYDAFESETGSLPTSGLMKAIVLNTAEDLGNKGPDFIYGWGRINARKAYEVIQSDAYTSGTISDGDSTQFTLIVPPNTSKARFMLYWTDPEASTSASTALVNDLDLTVMGPNSTVLQPYLLDHTPSTSALSAPATNGADHLNNMEQVEFESPTSGNYLVKVKGFDVPDGPQEFFIVYWFEPEEVVLTYPIGGESMVPFTTEKIRWDSPYTAGNATLEYSTDAGSSWTSITTSAPISAGYYDWTVAGTTTAEAQIRLTYNSEQVSSSDFSVIRTPTNLQVLYSCPDSIGLTWNNAAGATAYTVYKLGEKYMEEIGIATSNSFTDYNTNPIASNVWYSVSSIGLDSAMGKRMVAVQKQPGVFNCVIDDDASVESVSPESGAVFACHGDSVDFTFNLLNSGNNSISSLSAVATSSTGQTLSEIFTLSLGSGSSTDLTFADKLAVGSAVVDVEIVISMNGDGNPYNDTIRTVYYYQSSPTIAPIWSEDFESFSLCSTENDCGSTECALDNDWVNEKTYVLDDSDWRTNAGGTPSQFTGPSADHTLGNSAGKYVYFEASGGCTQQVALLTSPCIDLEYATTPMLSFWYSMNGADMGSISVDVFDGDIWYLNVFAISGNQGSNWDLAEVSLESFIGSTINIRFRGTTGSDYRSDIALDDIMITQPPVANFSYGVQLDGLTIDFTDLSHYGDSMEFDLGDGTVLDYVPASHLYAVEQVYTVQQIVINPVGSDTMVQDIITLGLNEKQQNRVVLYPNPSDQVLNIEGAEGGSEYTIVGPLGNVICSGTINANGITTVNIKHLSPGIYTARIDGEKTTPFSVVH